MKAILMAVLAVTLVTGCSRKDDRIAFDGQFYRAKLSKGDARHQFSVTARPVSASLDGARQAAEYEAISYCVKEYGSSDIAWIVGPDTDPAALPIADDTLVFQGACPE